MHTVKLGTDIVNANGVDEVLAPPLERAVEAIAMFSRCTLVSVLAACVGRVVAKFVTVELAFLTQENEDKILQPLQASSVSGIREGSRVLTVRAAPFCFVGVDITAAELDCRLCGATAVGPATSVSTTPVAP